MPRGDKKYSLTLLCPWASEAATFARQLCTVTSFPAQPDPKEHTWTLQGAPLLPDGGTAFSPGDLLMILSPDVTRTHRPTVRGGRAWLPHCPNFAAASSLICKELGAIVAPVMLCLGRYSDTGLGMVGLFFAQEQRSTSQAQNTLTYKNSQGQTTSDY